MTRIIQYRSPFGKIPVAGRSPRHRRKDERVVFDPSTKRSALKRLASQLTKEHVVRLPSLDHAGESEFEILRNLLLLLARGNVQISEPRLFIRQGGSVAKFCAALLAAKRDLIRRKKSFSAIVTAIMKGNEGRVGRPSKATAELIFKITDLRAGGASYRRTAKEAGVSRSLVMKILKIKGQK